MLEVNLAYQAWELLLLFERSSQGDLFVYLVPLSFFLGEFFLPPEPFFSVQQQFQLRQSSMK